LSPIIYGRTEAFNTKFGLSIVTAIGFSSLRDELPRIQVQGFGNDRQSLKNFGHSGDLIDGEIQS
jgi:hypothetical protein